MKLNEVSLTQAQGYRLQNDILHQFNGTLI